MNKKVFWKLNKLTVISAILTILNILSFTTFILILFFDIKDFYIALIIEVVFAISSLVFTIESREEKQMKLLIPMMIFDILIIVATPVFGLFGYVVNGMTSTHNKLQKEADYETSIECLKSIIQDKKIKLNDIEEGEQCFSYYDYNNKIAEKFNELNFTETTVSEDLISCYVEFYKDNDHEAIFSSDYTLLKTCWKAYSWSPYDINNTKYYSLDKTDAYNFKQIVRQEITSQKQAIIEKENEIKSDFSFKLAVESLSNKEYVDVVVQNLGHKEDHNKIVTNFLNEIEESNLTLYEIKTANFESYLTVGSNGSPYLFSYDIKNYWLKIFIEYTCPYHNKYYVCKDYILTQEDGDQFSQITTRLFS